MQKTANLDVGTTVKHSVLMYKPEDFAGLDDQQPTPWQMDQSRQDYLEWLYERDGRHDPAHPQHSLYTGLARARQDELTQACLDRLGQDLMQVEIQILYRRRTADHG